MARNRSDMTSRKPRAKKTTPKRQRKIDIPALAMSVDQFCLLHNIGRDLFYDLLKENKGPVCMLLGKRRLISFEASERWRREREAAATENAA